MRSKVKVCDEVPSLNGSLGVPKLTSINSLDLLRTQSCRSPVSAGRIAARMRNPARLVNPNLPQPPASQQARSGS